MTEKQIEPALLGFKVGVLQRLGIDWVQWERKLIKNPLFVSSVMIQKQEPRRPLAPGLGGKDQKFSSCLKVDNHPQLESKVVGMTQATHKVLWDFLYQRSA